MSWAWWGGAAEAQQSGGGVTATPSTLALALTTFAPTVSAPRLCTPTTKALTITTFAPTVTVGTLCTPATRALTITAFAPTVSAPRLCTPATKALTLATFAPTVSAPRLATPSTAALTISTFAPTVSTPRLVAPATLALTISTFAPTVATPRLVTPATAALTLATFAPVVTAGSGSSVLVTPLTLALTITTFAPTVAVAGENGGGLPFRVRERPLPEPYRHAEPAAPRQSAKVLAASYQHVGSLAFGIQLKSQVKFVFVPTPVAKATAPRPAIGPSIREAAPVPRLHVHAGRLAATICLASTIRFHSRHAELLALDELLIKHRGNIVMAEEEWHAGLRS